MKALSLWQPWASAIALGLKRIETRGWGTAYRGPLAIHAAKRPMTIEDQEWFADEDFWIEFGEKFQERHPGEILPYGAIVATARIVACERTEVFQADPLDDPFTGRSLSLREGFWGNYEPGRFGWVLEDIKALAKPIPYRGAQGLFEVPDDLLVVAA